MRTVSFDDSGADLRPKHRYRRYTQEYLDRLFSSADIVSVIGEHVELRSVGRDEWKGLCPFHDDHRPSLGVNQAKGVYRCYACNASGNVVSFLMTMEGLSFPETIRKLQQITGISPPSPQDALIDSFAPDYIRVDEDDGLDVEDLMWNIADIGGNALKSRPGDDVALARMMAIFRLADDALAADDRHTLQGVAKRLQSFVRTEAKV